MCTAKVCKYTKLYHIHGNTSTTIKALHFCSHDGSLHINHCSCSSASLSLHNKKKPHKYFVAAITQEAFTSNCAVLKSIHEYFFVLVSPSEIKSKYNSHACYFSKLSFVHKLLLINITCH